MGLTSLPGCRSLHDAADGGSFPAGFFCLLGLSQSAPDTFPPFWVGQKLQTGQTSLTVRTTPLVARTLDLLAHR